MKHDAEPPYDNSGHSSKVTSDCNQQFPSDSLKLDDWGKKIEQEVILNAKEGKLYPSIGLSQSFNPSDENPINYPKNESNCRDAQWPNATSEISLIAKEGLFYMDKTVTDVEAPHFLVSTKASPTVKDICVDEGVQMFEKLMFKYDKADQAILSCSNFPRVNENSELMEETRENENSEDLNPLMMKEVLLSSGKVMEIDGGDREFSSPSNCGTYLNETIDKTAKNDMESILVTGYPVEQCCCSNSVSEGRSLDTAEITAFTLPYEDAVVQISHFSEEFNTDFPQVDLSCHNEGTFENQVPEEEEDLTAMAASSPDKAKESKLIPATVSSNKDLFDKEKTSQFVLTSHSTDSSRTDNTKTDGAVCNEKTSEETSIAGNENKVVKSQQSFQSQIGVETEEPVSDGVSSARNSFSHLSHGDSNLLGPANIPGSIMSSSHISYLGNVSLRSESSTTSGQSFAFPILQSEWSSSPVRMAEADRRHLRKHRWKTALSCCKF